MAATIQREAELEEACNKNPETVKPEDLQVDLDDNEQDLDSAYRRPLRGIHCYMHKTRYSFSIKLFPPPPHDKDTA